MTSNNLHNEINEAFLLKVFHEVARPYPAASEIAQASFIKAQRMSQNMLRQAWPALYPPKNPNADGHPVLLLPGYGTDDEYMEPMGEFLQDEGYRVHYLEFGKNEGPGKKFHDHIQQRILEIFNKSGQKPSLIGVSWGGVTAVAAAIAMPRHVASVTMLGSPHVHKDMLMTVPLTSIYTPDDGVLKNWKDCILPLRRHFSNIKLTGGTHCGLASNPDAQRETVRALRSMVTGRAPHSGRPLVAA